MQRGGLLSGLVGVDCGGVEVIDRAWFFVGLLYRGFCLGGAALVVEAAAWLVAAVEAKDSHVLVLILFSWDVSASLQIGHL